MTKLEFMKELEGLLSDIPFEERNEALQYYNGYFEDAGEEHEDEIIKELGTPNKVAAIIKADLNSNAADRESRGYFTERGYQDTSYNDDKYEVARTAQKQEGNQGSTRSYNNTNNTNNTNDTNRSYGTKQSNESNQDFAGQSTYQNAHNTNKNQNTALLLIIGILTFPIWFPVLMSGFGIAIGIIAAILGIIFGFGIAGIVMIVTGVALFILGLIQISAPVIGILFVGCGLIVLGLGMLFTLGSIMLCKTVLPALIKGIVNLCRLPFKNRRVMV